MSRISEQARAELIEAVAMRYRNGPRREKTLILDEFVRITGFHRKHAIRVLRRGRADRVSQAPKPQPRIYDEAARQALAVLWEASDRICGKRLKPLLPLLVDALTRHGHLQLDDEIRSKLTRMSASTIDRLLAPARLNTARRRRKRPSKVKGQVPIRTFADWNDPPPGYLEIDLVAHSGGEMSGRFNHTLVVTDISSEWTECVTLPVRDSSLVVRGLESLRCSMPFPMRGIDSDNGGEFINDSVLEFCRTHGVEFTRSRPYKKNDQAWVEQKNGSVVRRIVGYGRLEGLAAAESLARLYSSSRLFANFFQPSFKLIRKERVGARVRKTYDTPQTPCARLLSSEHIDASAKETLRSVLTSLDPLRLLDEIRTMQGHIASLAAGKTQHNAPHRDADLDRFLASLEVAWKDGEIRPTHQPKPRVARYWRTRPDPFEAVWPEVLLWLETEPDATAKQLFDLLARAHPSRFAPGQLRTLQRRVKAWRKMAARRLVFADNEQETEKA